MSFTRRDLTVISCHFNPARFERPVQNLQRFLRETRRSGCDVVVVALALDDDPAVMLNSSRDVTVIDLRATRRRSSLWQKEALLNVALSEVKTPLVAWVDGDVMFAREDWADATARELDDSHVVQMFSMAHRMDRDAELEHFAVRSAGWWWSTRDKNWCDFTVSHPGFAWAARTDVLRAAGGLYDRVVTGCGDTMMMRAWTGKSLPKPFEHVGPRLANDVVEWAERLRAATPDLSLGFVMGAVIHMWHGDLRDRGNLDRRFILQDFDPRRHVVRREDGVLEWSDEAPSGLRERVAAYFGARKEDG